MSSQPCQSESLRNSSSTVEEALRRLERERVVERVIQLTDDNRRELPVPGEPYTFGILKQAQALGDFSSLEGRNRRALRFHIGGGARLGLEKLLEILRASSSSKSRSA